MHVPNRKCNDLRYTINSSKLHKLGWKEEKSWEEDLKTTVEWCKSCTSRYGNIDNMLAACCLLLAAHSRMTDVNGIGINYHREMAENQGFSTQKLKMLKSRLFITVYVYQVYFWTLFACSWYL